jgi:anti-sigma regulatory factor (Ser/Thr protein kinase)
MSRPRALPVAEPPQVGAPRRRVAALAEALGLGATVAGRVALVVTETATNVVRHGGGGVLLARALARDGMPGIEILVLDRGPGIADIGEALRDGYSTGDTPGTGLGAVRRLSSVFDIHSRHGVGTAVLSRVWAEAPGSRARPGLEIAGVSVPYPGEDVCGDAWADRTVGGCTSLIVADGLGHGPQAADAARAAVRAFLAAGAAPGAVLARVHDALRSTRGAAVGIAEIDPGRQVVRFAGVGNIAGSVRTGGQSRHLVSHNGIAGHEVRRIDEFTCPWPAGALLVLHSDGIATHWDLGRYRGLSERDPALVAGVLYRDFARGRDDATVVVARAGRP